MTLTYMLHIILLILKIIGIILLCILGVLLLAISCAFFVPLRYRIEVFREEGEGNPPFVVHAKVTWLLHLVNILLCYPADVYVRVRIFLFTLFQIPEAEKKQTKEKSERKKKRKKKKPGETDENTAGKEVEQAEEEQSVPDAGKVPDAEDKSSVDTSLEQVKTVDPENTGETKDTENTQEAAPEPSGPFRKWIYKISQKVRNLLNKIRQFLDRIKNAFQNILYTIRHMCDKIKSTSNTIQYYREVLQSDAFQHSWELCKGQIGILLRALKPDKFEADLIVGTGDPASTGEILAVYGMLYPFLGEHVRIVGDFEQAHVEGHLFIKGKIRAFTFLRVAWKVYRNKDIRTLIKLFKKEAV